MTTNNEFEKWAFSQGHKVCRHHLDHNDYAETSTFFMWNAWQAATSESNKRIDILLEQQDRLIARNDELQASNHDLREELEKYVPSKAYKDNGKWFIKTKQTTGYVECEVSEHATALDTLFAAPAESLLAFENEVIEKCAKVCNDMLERRGVTFDHKFMADTCAYAIRALKEVK